MMQEFLKLNASELLGFRLVKNSQDGKNMPSGDLKLGAKLGNKMGDKGPAVKAGSKPG